MSVTIVVVAITPLQKMPFSYYFPKTQTPVDPVRTPTSNTKKNCAPFVCSFVVCVCARESGFLFLSERA